MSGAAPTRRGFLGGAAGAAGALALPGLAQAAPDAARAPWATARQVVRRGRAIATSPRGERLLVAHDRRRSVAIVPRGGGAPVVVELAGQPFDVAVARGGRTGAVTSGSWDRPGLTLLDLRAGTVRHRVGIGPAPGRVAFTHDGRRVVVAGGEQEGTICVVRAADGKTLRAAAIGVVPRGIAVAPGDRHAWIALAGEDRVVRVDLRTGRLTRSLATPALPDRIALSPRGDRLLLTHADPRAEHVTELDLRDGRARRLRAGPQPCAVGWTASGRRVAALGGDGAVAVLGARRTLRRLGAPARDLAVVGRRVFTVSDLDDVVRAVRA